MPEADLRGEAPQPLSPVSHFPSFSSSARVIGADGPAAGSTRRDYLPQLDGLRGLAVFMVFVHHAYAVPLLWSGVDLFFILSGYLITNILLRDSVRMSFGRMLRHFYLRRAQRILPAYLLCLAAIALFTQQPWARIWPFYAFFLQNIPYAFHLIPVSPLIPLWSLAVEQHFYFFWPFLVFFLPRRALAPCMVAVLVALPFLRAFCTPLFAYSEAFYVLTPFRIDTMAAGALVALWLPHLRKVSALRIAAGSILVGVLSYALLFMHPWFRRSANTPAFNGLAYSLNILILGGLFLLAVSARLDHPLNRLLTFAPLRGLGRISYAFYLFQLLILVRFGTTLGPRFGPLVCFCITLALAAGSWYLVEKPILTWRTAHLR